MQHCGTIVYSEGPLPSRDILVALSENLDDEYLQPAAEVISCDFISKLDIALSWFPVQTFIGNGSGGV